MAITKTLADSGKPKEVQLWTLTKRRAFLKLSMQERRRILAEQAARAAAYYRPDAEWMEMSSTHE